MKNLSAKWIGFAVFAVVIAAVAIFAVLPMLPNIDSTSNFSLSAIFAEACCGGNDGPGGPGGRENPPTPPQPVPLNNCTLSVTPGSFTEGQTPDIKIKRTTDPDNGWFRSETYLNGNKIGSRGYGESGSSSHINATDRFGSKARPTEPGTHTYTHKVWRASDRNGNRESSPVTCTDTIVVKALPTPAPTCTLDANPGTIEKGKDAKLTWTTKNADTVSINQGIGSVGKNSSKTVSPSKTTTYTLTAKGAGGTVTCKDTVTVKSTPKPPAAPTCTLDASPEAIKEGASSKLTWTTTGANSVTINQGIGGVAKNDSKNVSPKQTTTYTLTAKGDGGEVKCKTIVSVTPKPAPAPTCTLTVDPSVIEKGGSAVLKWTTKNADQVSLSSSSGQGVGDAFDIEKNKTMTVSPNATTNYTLVASGEGGTVYCRAKIEVKVPAPTCTLTTHPSSIEKGEATKLTWTTENAHTVSINQGIGGQLPKSGSKIVRPDGTTTFKLVAEGDSGTVHCLATVKVTKPTPAPTCTLTAHPSSIEKGESTKLTWTTKNAHTVSINQGIGNVAKNDSKTVRPGETTTFKLTAKGDGGTVHCFTTVKVTKPAPAPVCTFTTHPGVIDKGDASKLTWTTKNAKTVTIDQGIGQVAKNDSRNVRPNKTTTYTLTAKGDGGTVKCTAKVKVNAPAPTCTLSPETQTITKGDTAKLSFTTANADKITLTTKNGQTKTETLTGPDGNISKVLNANTDFTLKAKNTKTGKEVTCESEVFVQQPEAPTCTLVIKRQEITLGDSIRPKFETTNADRIVITRALLGGGGRVELENTTSPSGSIVDTPNSVNTFVYRGVATGPGGQAICKDKVIVNEQPEPEPLTCDAFTASPSTLPHGGGSSTLTWETTNATNVSIDQSVVGNLPVDGSTKVEVTDTTTFTLTATRGNDTVKCDTTITVKDKPSGPNLSCDAFGAAPSNLPVGGGETKLTWETTDATKVSIDNGVGDDLAKDGEATVNVTDDTTFTLTATRGNDTVTCDTTVTVEDPTTGGSLSCDVFDASPNPLPVGGGNTTLTWETTGATNVSISNGVGDNLDLDGSATINVTESTNFLLTASRGSEVVRCDRNVVVETSGGGGGGGGSSPRCDLFEISDRLSNGDIVLHWETRRGRDMVIEPGVLETSDNDFIEEGYATITPQTGTDRYTLTVERGSRDDSCFIDVNDPDITVVSDRQPLVIALSDVPYTGFEAGPALTALFYSVLVVWSLAIAYVLVIKREPVLGVSLPERQHVAVVENTVIPHAEYTASTAAVTEPVQATPTIPVNLPTGELPNMAPAHTEQVVSEAAPATDEAHLENHAHSKQVLLSSDAIRMIQDQEYDPREQITLLDEIVDRAKVAYPREDGWLVVNRERINRVFARGFGDDTNETAPAEQTPAPVEAPAGASSLAEAIITGNITAAYQSLGHDPMLALADAASALDRVYRARRGEQVAVNDMLMRAATVRTDEQMLASIEALLSAIDGTYADETAAVKLAVMKAVNASV